MELRLGPVPMGVKYVFSSPFVHFMQIKNLTRSIGNVHPAWVVCEKDCCIYKFNLLSSILLVHLPYDTLNLAKFCTTMNCTFCTIRISWVCQ